MRPNQTIVVRGRYPFPWDMLRFDQAAPVNGHEAGKLAELAQVDPENLEQRRKRYRIIFNVYSSAGSTPKRWDQFNWNCWDIGDPEAPAQDG